MVMNRFWLWPAKKMRLHILHIYYKPLPFDLPQFRSLNKLLCVSVERKDNPNSACSTKQIKNYSLSTVCKATVPVKSGDKKIPTASVPPGNTTPPPKRKGFIERATYSGKCRWGFIPEEYFHFFYPLTGVSGGYLFLLGIANFMLSKEIFVLEHEYYSGLSILVIILYVVKVFGKTIGASLDKEVDAIIENFKKVRQNEINMNQKNIDYCKDLQQRAKAQKLLIDGKKENIAMQLEAAYRERTMMLYRRVKGRLDYHVMRHRSEKRIEHKWMMEWILEQVRKSITPEFQQKALVAAINDLASAADRYKKTK